MAVGQDEIHRLSLSKSAKDRSDAALLFINIFESIPDTYAAWSDMHRLIDDENSGVRGDTAFAIGAYFSFIPDKEKAVASNDLYKIINNENNEDWYVRRTAILSLCSAFEFVPDKSAAWDQLHLLIKNKHWYVRKTAISALGSAFEFVPDKSAAWNDLHMFASSEDNVGLTKCDVAYTFGCVFKHIPDKYKSAAYDDLHTLINDDDSGVRCSVVSAIGSVFEHISSDYESTVCSDLYSLTMDKEWRVREKVADVLGSIFSLVPDKYKPIHWSYLDMLAIDEDIYVRSYATCSLGKICIYKASKSENENDARSQLEKAIQYFEKSTEEGSWRSPAKFCHPFYCTFDAVMFKKVHSKMEIENYITAAKKEILGSKSRQKLIESIEQLSEALEIAHDAYVSGGNWQEILKRCSDICNYAEQLMDENKDKAPDIYDLYEMAKPAFDKKIKELIEAADIAFKKAKGTPAENVVDSIKREIQRWSVEDPIKMDIKIERLYAILKEKVPDIPENRIIIGQINDIKNTRVVEDQLEIITLLMMSIPNISVPKMIDDLKENMNNRFDIADGKADKNNETASDTNKIVTRTENKVDLLLQTVNELKEIASKLKKEGNEKGSKDVNDIADKIKVLFENKDPREITLFIEKLRENVPSLFEEIEKSTAPKDVKEKAKKGLKEAIMETGKDITSGVATNWIAAYLTSIVMVGAPGLLVLGTILTALISIENIKNQR